MNIIELIWYISLGLIPLVGIGFLIYFWRSNRKLNQQHQATKERFQQDMQAVLDYLDQMEKK